MPSPTELARDALQKTEVLENSVALLKERLDRLDTAQLRERLVVLESRLVELEKALETLKPTKAEAEEMGALKSRLTQLEEQKKLGDTRAFQFIVLFIGGLITLAINIALLFLKK
jgi:phage shock protein A